MSTDDPSGRPDPPDHLSDRQAALWREHVAVLDFEPHELELLRRLCEAGDRADEARVQIEVDGLTYVDRFGQPRPHPLIAVERDARTAVARLTRELRFPTDEPAPDPRPPRPAPPRRGGR